MRVSMRLLAERAPVSLAVPSGHTVQLDYSSGRPVLAVKLQEAHVAYSRAAVLLGPGRASFFGAVVPGAASLLAIPVLDEIPTTLQLAGLVARDRIQVDMVPPAAEASIFGPPKALAETLRNLMKNAVQASPADAPVVLRTAPNTSYLKVSGTVPLPSVSASVLPSPLARKYVCTPAPVVWLIRPSP